MIIENNTLIQIMPEFNDPDVCKDYDEECFLMSQERRVRCAISPNYETIVGICPFLD